MIQANLFLLATYTIFVSMKTPVDIWVELDARLSSFGQDAASREVIVREERRASNSTHISTGVFIDTKIV